MSQMYGRRGDHPALRWALPVLAATALLLPGCPNPADVTDEPDIYLQQDGGTVGKGETVLFSATLVGDSRDLTFRIENRGTADLLLTGGSVSLSGSATFTVQKGPATTIEAEANTTFIVRFSPIDTTSQQATVSIASNDPDENPFTFKVSGAGSVVSGSILIEGGDLYTNSTSVTLTLNPDDPGSVDQMLLSNSADFFGASWEDFLVSRAWTLASGDGTKTVYVKFRDTGGNDSSVFSDDIVLDTVPPGAPGVPDLDAADDSGISSTDDLTRRTTGLTFSGTGAEADSTIQLYANAVILDGVTAAVAGDGSWTSADASLAEGTWSITARAIDPAGNTSDPSPDLSVQVDTTAPGVPSILEPMQGANTGTQRRPTFTWSAVADAARYHFQADSSSSFTLPIGLELVDYDGTSFTPTSDLAVSTSAPVGRRYYLRVQAIDAAGNPGPYSHAGMLRYVNVGRFDQDLNGDGFSDVVVGIPYKATDDGTEVGTARVFLGGSTMNAIADLIVEGEAAFNCFGFCVAFAGDVNGDGYADLLVGAPYNDATGSSAGAAYLYLGGSTPNAAVDLTLTGAAAGDFFGYSVAGAGDVNGDGYTDLLVGAPGDVTGSSAGASFLYLGGATLNATADLTLTGAAAGDRFGFSVAGAGDVNGDGYADLLVGAPWNDAAGYFAGAASLYLGGGTLNATADMTLTGAAAEDEFGSSVASAGDVNGDGYADLLVGAPNNDAGAAYLYLGGGTLNGTADLTLTGAAAEDEFGWSVAGAGDVDGDGYADFLVGVPYNDAAGSNAGAAFLYLGDSTPSDEPEGILSYSSAGDSFGHSVSGAGDVDGDGYADLVIGVPNRDEGATNGGGAPVFFGGLDMDTSPDVLPSGAPWAESDNFGWSVD